MKKVNGSKVFMIMSICVLCISVMGSAFAMYRQNLFADLTVDTVTHGLDYYINYASGTDITSGTLNPGTDYLSGNYATVEFWKKDNTYDIYGHIYLDINEITSVIQNSSSVKYTLVDNVGNIINSGRVSGETGSSMLLKSNIPLETTTKLYILYIWLDENEELDVNMTDNVLSVSIRCEATMEQI